MKKSLLAVSLLALMSLAAQANDVEKLEATVSQIMEDAGEAPSQAQAQPEGTDGAAAATDGTVAPDADKNDTQEEQGEEQAPATDAQ